MTVSQRGNAETAETSPVVHLSQVGKCYRVYGDPGDRLKQAILGARRRYYQESWAVRNVSFNVLPGETVGLVGRNGSGKSTLLQIIAGTLTATEGECTVRGRIGALLELGSGFNPEFTGLENIFLSASLCGFGKRETEAQLQAICDFAEIGDFIGQPIKTYSSGMVVRLAFAVQAQLRPDILIVDEALAVGDELFQKKCYSHISRLKENGTAIVLVTHNCSQVLEHCDRAVLLHQGQQWLTGSAKQVVDTYQRLMHAPSHAWEAFFRMNDLDANTDPTRSSQAAKTTEQRVTNEDALIPTTREIYPHGELEIVKLDLRSPQGFTTQSLQQNTPLELVFRYRVHRTLSAAWFGCHIATTEGQRLTGQRCFQSDLARFDKGDEFEVSFFFHGALMEGTYFVGGGSWSSEGADGWIHRVVDGIAIRIHAKHQSSFGSCDLMAEKPQLTAVLNG